MKIISTKIHGFLDYLVGAVLIISPWLFGFANAHNELAKWVPIILGIAAFVYSLLTDYEWGAVNIISMKIHLKMDLLSGILLASSPWIFGFKDEVFIPHVILGVLEIVAATVTKTNRLKTSNPEFVVQ